MKFTVLGARGFIGSHLVRHLHSLGHQCGVPGRDVGPTYGPDLGHVIYSIGLTADFRARWLDTVRAHVSDLAEFLAQASFDSFLYLSSTRVYARSAHGEETGPLAVAPLDLSDLYNLTKLAGESICFSSGRSGVRVARLSNVYGPDLSSVNFLSSLIRAAIDKRRIVLETAPDSVKDFVSVEDVVRLIPRIAESGRERLYNIASGREISNQTLIESLKQITGCAAKVNHAAPSVNFPKISIARVSSEFGFRPRFLLDDLPSLVDQFRAKSR